MVVKGSTVPAAHDAYSIAVGSTHASASDPTGTGTASLCPRCYPGSADHEKMLSRVAALQMLMKSGIVGSASG